MANCPKQLSNYTDRLALRNFLPPPPPLPHPILSALCSWDLDCVWWRQTGINQLKFLLCNSRPAEIQTQFGLDRDGATERQRDSLLLWKIADLHLWMQKDSGRKQVLMCLERSGGRCGFLVASCFTRLRNFNLDDLWVVLFTWCERNSEDNCG